MLVQHQAHIWARCCKYFFGEFTDCKCQVAARQALGTIHIFTIVQVVVAVFGAGLLFGEMNAELQLRMGRSIA